MMNTGVYARSNFQDARIRRGFTLRGIAKSAGITPAVLSRLENGGAIMPSTASKVCIVLGLEFDDLFEIRRVNDV